jgi:hypothetical protein
VKVTVEWGGLSALDGRCTFNVDGKDVPGKLVK